MRRTVSLEYGEHSLPLAVPGGCDVLRARPADALADPGREVLARLREPTGTGPLRELARGRASAAVVISDNTRPVPYRGPGGILVPILDVLKSTGVEKITVIVGCGTHRPLDDAELHDLLDPAAFREGVSVINHVATDESMLRRIGSTALTPEVTVNRHYVDADLKIVTGLVEPHFMAGYSGGRKGVCPAICGQAVTQGFHSARVHESDRSASLVLEGNPCHEESLRIARMAGVDFIVNAAIDSRKRTTGIFAGALEAAHLAAVGHVRSFASIPVLEPYDAAVIPAGAVGVNHYQCAKPAVEAARAVRPGGAVIVLARLTEPEPLGSKDYRTLLRLLAEEGPTGYMERILSDDWSFVHDQWTPQMWAKVFQKLGSAKRVYTCAPRLEDIPAADLPETNVAALAKRSSGEDEVEFARRILQETVDRVAGAGDIRRVVVLPDGPYAVPVPGGME